MVQHWQTELSRAISQAIEAGELIADLNMHDLVFELHGVVLALHHDARLLKSPGSVERATRSFERIIASYLETGHQGSGTPKSEGAQAEAG